MILHGVLEQIEKWFKKPLGAPKTALMLILTLESAVS